MVVTMLVSEPILCPICDEVTLPNRLENEEYVCSCAAHNVLHVDTAQTDCQLVNDEDANWRLSDDRLPPPFVFD